jgi:hypothetical protein
MRHCGDLASRIHPEAGLLLMRPRPPRRSSTESPGVCIRSASDRRPAVRFGGAHRWSVEHPPNHTGSSGSSTGAGGGPPRGTRPGRARRRARPASQSHQLRQRQSGGDHSHHDPALPRGSAGFRTSFSNRHVPLARIVAPTGSGRDIRSTGGRNGGDQGFNHPRTATPARDQSREVARPAPVDSFRGSMLGTADGDD